LGGRGKDVRRWPKTSEFANLTLANPRVFGPLQDLTSSPSSALPLPLSSSYTGGKGKGADFYCSPRVLAISPLPLHRLTGSNTCNPIYPYVHVYSNPTLATPVLPPSPRSHHHRRRPCCRPVGAVACGCFVWPRPAGPARSQPRATQLLRCPPPCPLSNAPSAHPSHSRRRRRRRRRRRPCRRRPCRRPVGLAARIVASARERAGPGGRYLRQPLGADRVVDCCWRLGQTNPRCCVTRATSQASSWYAPKAGLTASSSSSLPFCTAGGSGRGCGLVVPSGCCACHQANSPKQPGSGAKAAHNLPLGLLPPPCSSRHGRRRRRRRRCPCRRHPVSM
jgi:hypothetical protein